MMSLFSHIPKFLYLFALLPCGRYFLHGENFRRLLFSHSPKSFILLPCGPHFNTAQIFYYLFLVVDPEFYFSLVKTTKINLKIGA